MTVASGLLGQQISVDPTATVGIPPTFAGSTFLGHQSDYINTAHPGTGNKILGWQWDKRVWAAREFENQETLVAGVLDPTTSGLDSSYFQSGIGAGEDLKLTDIVELPSSGLNAAGIRRLWSPVINHGYFYDFEQGHYLHSDDAEVQYPTYTGVVQGIATDLNEIRLDDSLKPGNPVTARQYVWNSSRSKYDVSIDFTKKANFTGLRDDTGARQDTFSTPKDTVLFENIDPTDPEFTVVYSGDHQTATGDKLPIVIFNDQFVQEIGSGSVPADLDLLGISTGADRERFHLTWSPVDTTQPINIYSWTVSSGIINQWEAVVVDTTATISGLQAFVDPDLGIIEFGDTTVSGELIPSGGSFVGAHYWRTVELAYEPEYSVDTVTAAEANINPLHRQSYQGFVYLSTEDEEPVSLELSARLPVISTDIFGPLYVGGSSAAIVATVKGAREQLIEGQTVTFEMTGVLQTGSFSGNASSVTATSDQNGEATSHFFSPSGTDEMGESVEAAEMTVDNSPTIPSGATQTTTFRTTTLPVAGTEEDIFLYQVWTDDPLQGLLDPSVALESQDQIDEYYRQFFVNEDIWGATGMTSSGVTTAEAISWEDSHRLLWGLSRPLLFGANAGAGRRTIVTVLDSGALNPHTYETGAIVPIQPSVIQKISDTDYDLIFNSSSADMPVPTGYLHSYQVISPTVVTLRASVYNRTLGRTILSNEIQIRIDIPPYAKGLWEVDLLNGLAQSEISSLITSAMEGEKVPLGWRLRSSNVTLAGALNGVTFLDTNVPYDIDLWDTASGIALRQEVTVTGVAT
jgi:hypothetical protein